MARSKVQLWSWRKTDLYIDTRDWWVGIFLDKDYLYICLVPCVVIRIIREIKGTRAELDNEYGTEGW